jgi:hypothetical protein
MTFRFFDGVGDVDDVGADASDIEEAIDRLATPVVVVV